MKNLTTTYPLPLIFKNAGLTRSILCLLFSLASYVLQAQIIYVTPSGAGNKSGSSWSNAAPGTLLQSKINGAESGSDVWVAAGIYKPNSILTGCENCGGDPRNYTFSLRNTISIYGGFKGDERMLTDRSLSGNPSILSGDIGVEGDMNDNVVHVVSSIENDNSAVLDGFVIREGIATTYGQALVIGQATSNRYGIWQYEGGGMTLMRSAPQVINCIFTNNTARFHGGGVLDEQGSASFVNCVFSNNIVYELGASWGGGISLIYSTGSSLINCTFTGNHVNATGAAVEAFYSQAPVRIANCIIWGNTAGINYSPVIRNENGKVQMNNSIIQGGGYSGTGNLDKDPLFINSANGDVRLKPNSPALNIGDNAFNSTITDLAGNPRKFGVIDLGAYEYQCAPTVITSQPQNAFACSGSTAAFTVGVTGSNLIYKWYKDGQSAGSSDNAATLTIENVKSSDAGSYTVDIISSCGTITSNAAILTVNSAPAISTQPVTTTVCQGLNATYSITVSGMPAPVIGWQYSTNGGLSWININTVSSSSVSIPTAAMSGVYKVRAQVINTCGGINSDVATLTVNSAPVIGTQPVAATKCTGEAVSFNVSATGTGLSYQWKKNEANITDATSSTYNIAAVSAADAADYSVAINGACGSPVTSNAVALTINTAPVITAQPVAATKCAGEDVSFSVSASGTDLNYQWKKNGSDISGATFSTYNITAVNNADAADYSVTVSGTCGSPVTSNAVALLVNTAPVITSPPVFLTKCAGEAASFSVSATGAGLSYQWKKYETNISGATESTYTIASVSAGDAGNYSVTVSGTCSPPVTRIIPLIVNTAAAITAQPVSATKCAGENASFSVLTTGRVLNYQWKKNGANISGATSSTYNIAAVSGADAADYSVTVSGTCGSPLTSNAVALIVKTATVITSQPVFLTKCTGEAASFSVSATGAGLSYQWKKYETNISGATESTYTIASVSASDAGDYSVTVSGTCSPPVTIIIPLIVNTAVAITAQPVSATKCAGENASFSVLTTGRVLSYQWKKNGTNISGATSFTYNVPAVSAADAADYSVTVTGTCGSPVTSNAVALIVNTAPLITAQPVSASKCAGEAVSFSVAVTGTGLIYQWKKNGVNINGATSSSYSIAGVSAADAAEYSATVSGACGSPVSSNEVSLTVNTLPAATITASGSTTICPNGLVTLTASNGASYIWSTGATDRSINVSEAGSYSVTITNTQGCTASSAPTVVTVADTEAPVVTNLPIIKEECAATVLPVNGTDNCAGSIVPTTNDLLTYDKPGTYVIHWTYNDGNGNSITKEQTVIIKDETKPVAAVTTLPDLTGCSVTVSAKPTATDNCAGIIQGITNDPLTYTIAGNYTITWNYNDGNGNTSTQTQKVNVSAIAKPTIVASGTTTFCQGGSVTLSAPAGFTSYKWSNGSDKQSITVNAGGSYNVTVTNAGGCSNTSDAVTISVGNDTQKPVVTCPAATTLCYVANETYALAALQATDNCTIASTSYAVTGATSRTGSGANASGIFKPGTSTITWTVKDAAGNTSTCQSSVVVNPKFTVTIPDGWALGSGCTLNTVYKGYLPAAYILLTAKPTGGKSPYTYKWSNGSTASYVLVNPASATTYSVTIKDTKGCTQTASKQINVVDVRCGSKMDMVSLCSKGKTLCILTKDVANYLLNGAYLGSCKVTTSSKIMNEASEEMEASNLIIKVAPNPSTTNFKLSINSTNLRDKVRMTIMDGVGKVLETRVVNAGETIQLGDNYRAGIYYAEAVQGNKRTTVKLIKQGW